MEEMFRVGVITSTHALAGEVKVYPTTQDPQRFKTLKRALIATGQALIPVEIERVRFFKQFVIVKMKGYDRIEDVEGLVKKEMYVSREDAIPLEEGEYYVADLIGLRVITDEEEELGTLADVLQTGANDVYVVRNGEREILIPVIPDCILAVDIPGGLVRVHLLKGLV